MGLSTAMTFFEAPATLLGLNCVFRKGATHTANQVYCVIGLSLKILVSAQCLYLVLEEVVESKPHVNVTNILLLAFYKGVSIFLFLSVIYFHLCKHQGYCKIISTLSEEAKNIGCYEELYLWLRKYSAIAGAAAFGVIFCMFLVQFTQVNIGPKIHVAHSAVTAFTCVYFEMKFAILAKASKFIFKRINVIIIQAEYNPRKAAKIPSLRKTHDALYFLVEEASANFQCIFIFSTMLQFQVALYASYISCINIWDLEDTFLKIKIQLLLISAIWVFAIVANYIHLTSNCAANLAEAQGTANVLLRMEMNGEINFAVDEAKLFQNQILQYRYIRYNVFGLFYLDKTFIFTLLGGLTTYLATLVQFHLLAQQLPGK